MQLQMWTYDIAREQSPSYEHLRDFCRLSLDSGYNAIGLYLEHRFAYPSTPWSHGIGCVTPDMIEALQREFAELQIVPFINLLGHCEGFIYTEQGKRYREERFAGMQTDPSNPEWVALAHSIVDDTLRIFSSEIIHIGGDETWQLGACPRCKERVESAGDKDGKADLYGQHFGPLADRVVQAGRRPGVWGDMFIDHPTALGHMPKETLIFDWQYFNSPIETSGKFKEAGFEVVCCPTVHTYNATWCHLPQTEENVRQNVRAAHELGALGVCVTTWENGLFGNYEVLRPVIAGCGKLLSEPQTTSREINLKQEASPEPKVILQEFAKLSEKHEEWARRMGVELQSAGGTFAFGGIRSSIKVRLLLNSNPFLCWLHHQEEFCGEVGEKALRILDEAILRSPDTDTRGIAEFGKAAIEFVRFADQARQAYAQGLPGVATASLAPCRQIFENLERTARATHLNAGGSLADIERCKVAREHVERVIRRIKEYGDGSLGYLPAFEHITHPKFMPHDQAAWWLINRWANE